MPTIPKVVKMTAPAAIMLNAIRGQASVEYQERIPEATQQNLAAIWNAMDQYPNLQNEFAMALINRIGRVLITSKSYSNPLRMFKRGMMELGETVEEVFVNIARAHTFNPERAERTVFARELPDVAAAYHRMNYKNFYKTTISREQLRQAFLSNSGLENLIGYIVNSLYSGSEVDEFVIMKQMIVDAAQNGRMFPIHVAPIDAATSKEFVQTIRATVTTLEFPSGSYNYAGVTTFTPRADQVLILDPKTEAAIDVNVLAAAFNMDKAEFLARRVIIDNFGELTGAIAALVDKDWFMVLDNLIQMESIRNPEGLYWNYFYHVWKTFSTSPFCNAILFTTSDVGTVSTVTVTGPATVKKNNSYHYDAKSELSGLVSGALKWEVTGSTNSDTYVDGQGNLHVAYDEEAGSLTVKATSIHTPGVSGDISVTIE